MRIQTLGIEIHKGDPFKHDLLNRRDAVETLTHLVGNLEGPCVIAVDAAWGFGKTTFLRMWAQYLRNEGFPVVGFNAWETDFSEDPFLTLSTELMEGIKSSGSELPCDTMTKLQKASQEILFHVLPGAIRSLASCVPVIGSGIGEGFASLAEEKMSQHLEARTSIKQFREIFQDTAVAISEANGNHPLIVTIDELDRCRPSYAVELLEVAKHLFAVNHVIFVLAVNRDQLAHSVKALYGHDFDADGYLRRFFDLDFKLPEPSRHIFIQAQLQATGISDYFGLGSEKPDSYNTHYLANDPREKLGENVRCMLLMFFGTSDLSLRTVGQAIHRLGLLYASLRRDQHDFALATTVALILRTLDPKLYDRFVRREISDRDVVGEVFRHPGLKPQRFIDRSAALFEAVIILATLGNKMIPDMPSSEPSGSLLLDRYGNWERIISELSEENDPEDSEIQAESHHAKRVMSMLGRWSGVNDLMGFTHAVKRIELLDVTLINE
ncbi:MAG: P-loop NTPase fold protein [Gammaproteobacteria bacterium]|nr:P-loop NTPase fold protein [Gammaproteobacteria bacterium]